RDLRNVEWDVVYGKDMAVHYQQAHATLAPFTDLRRAKRAPNSVVESLACGRPVIVTEAVGLAELIREGRAGIVCGPTGLDLAEALDRLQADWRSLARNARAVAERWVGVGGFF